MVLEILLIVTDIQRLNNIFNWFSTYENVASPSDPISGVVSLTDSKINLNSMEFTFIKIQQDGKHIIHILY